MIVIFASSLTFSSETLYTKGKEHVRGAKNPSHIPPIISPLTLRLHEVESTHLMYIHERMGGMMGGICEG